MVQVNMAGSSRVDDAWKRGPLKQWLRRRFPALFSVFKISRRYPWLYSITPEVLEPSLSLLHRILFDYGYAQSCQRKSCLDGQGLEIPWYTYPAIQYLNHLDFSGKSVFEFGAGASTLWWARRASRVVSVEHVPDWYAALSEKLPANCELMLETDETRYCESIRGRQEDFDVAIVDGMGANFTRLRCATAALERIRPSGMIIVDNADWLPRTCEALRSAGMTQVDFDGAVPLNAECGRTSLFFKEFGFGWHGAPTVGGVEQNWEAGEIPASQARV
jgi:hypothetical protein